ncbi:peptidase associated/transthyretin-like domain-containing protein [Hymenobacter guriensis]|uniref:Carboxypeptidase-like regulatory domain-containing protein n=1 Tax=Hymenobacter guriensis TaxID=2793065 RepID=A0ABS0L853_9BACT|nr:hypothetical protein [Hymenobacter guriensis]MBG8556329.1 hypothetical protein [Hymenobacter guriensis]
MTNPLSGVSVRPRGLFAQVSVTDSLGRFRLQIPATGDGAVVVTFEGYYAQQVLIGRGETLHVVLQPIPGFYRRFNRGAISSTLRRFM